MLNDDLLYNEEKTKMTLLLNHSFRQQSALRIICPLNIFNACYLPVKASLVYPLKSKETAADAAILNVMSSADSAITPYCFTYVV